MAVTDAYMASDAPMWQQPEAKARLKARQAEQNKVLMDLLPKAMRADTEYQNAQRAEKDTVPDAPFKKNWHELALKKMIHHAATNGYDSIAITPGAEQVKRYGLSKHVGRITHMTHLDNPDKGILFAFDPKGNQIAENHNIFHEDLPRYIGKEGAQKLLAQKPDENGYRELSGQNLEVGGEGMKGFYDKMIPSFLNQFGKKYGSQVQSGTVETRQYTSNDRSLRQLAGYSTPVAETAPVHMFNITPQMREDVMKNGIPLYAEGGKVDVRPTVKDDTLQRKIPEIEEAAKALQTGIINRKDYDKVVNKHKPVKPYTFVPQPASDEDAERALMANKKPHWRGHQHWPAGRKVGLRLDIPAYETHGVWVNSIHDEEGKGEDKQKTSYGPVSSVKNATFDAGPAKGIKVATGEDNKSPFARIHGELHHMTEDKAVEHMKTNLNHPDYVQVGMDPRRHGFFYDRKSMKPVTHSAHVVQIGPLVLAHKPTYGKREAYADGGSVMGINVASDRKSDRKYADMIVDGHKTFESRNSDTLRPYVGKRVAIVRTGEGKAKAIGEVTIGEPTVVNKQKFRALEDKHHVPEGSAFDIGNNTKHLYPLSDPVRYEQERDVGHGIVARKVLAHGGDVSRETIKPVGHGYTREQVTVAPNLDAMKYELMSVKHFVKKAK